MTRRRQQMPATVEELRARATAVIRDRLQTGRELSAAWLAESVGLTSGGALKFLREHATAGRLTRYLAAGGPASYLDTWTAAVPVEDWPAPQQPAAAVDAPTTAVPGEDAGRPVFRVLVTGSRTWTDAAAVTAELSDLHEQYGDRLVVVHGGCRTGADRIADGWARRHGVATETHPADWDAGRGAGPARNTAMVATSPDACLAFIRDQSPGASGCADLAEQAGIATTRHTAGTVQREPAAEAAPPHPTTPAPMTQASRSAVQPARAERRRGSSAELPGQAPAQLPDVTDVLFAGLDLVGR